MQIILRDTANQAERIFYNTPDFPLYLGEQHISVFVNYCALSHWHDDVEFIVVRSGRLHYNINGTVLVLEPGQGLFINSRQLHNGFSPHREDCVFLCVRLAPPAAVRLFLGGADLCDPDSGKSRPALAAAEPGPARGTGDPGSAERHGALLP